VRVAVLSTDWLAFIMETKQKIIMRDSPEAAVPHTMTGWLSASGRFYRESDESIARYDGFTHQKCETEGCDGIVEKSRLYCEKCQETLAIAKHNAREKKEWNGTDLLFSDLLDEYTQEPDELLATTNDERDEELPPLTLDDLRLRICDPVHARTLSADHFCDELPEDGDLPPDLEAAIETFNATVEKLPPLSWYPGKYAAIVANQPDQRCVAFAASHVRQNRA
jgi:hypothetical protein